MPLCTGSARVGAVRLADVATLAFIIGRAGDGLDPQALVAYGLELSGDTPRYASLGCLIAFPNYAPDFG
jgi:hypothetical protein